MSLESKTTRLCSHSYARARTDVPRARTQGRGCQGWVGVAAVRTGGRDETFLNWLWCWLCNSAYVHVNYISAVKKYKVL